MKGIIIPEDIRKLGRNKIIRCVVIFEILLVCSGLILYLAGGKLHTCPTYDEGHSYPDKEKIYRKRRKGYSHLRNSISDAYPPG